MRASPVNGRGKVAMQAINENIVNINGNDSFGITTVFNEGLSKNFFINLNN